MAVASPPGPLSEVEVRRVRYLLRCRPTAAALAELDAMAGVEGVVPGFLLSEKNYDAEKVTAAALHELLRWRFADPWDYWRSL